MPVDGAHVIAGAEFVGFPGLPHQVDEVALSAGDERIAAAMPSTSRLGITLVNSEPGPRVITSASAMAASAAGSGRHLARAQADRLDALLAAADAGLADDDCAVGQRRFQRHVGRGAGVDAAGDLEHFRGGLDGVRKIAHDLRQRREKEVAEAVSLEPAAGLEAVLEEAREQRGVLAERDHAVADVAGRQDVELAAQAAANCRRRRSP